MGVGEVSRRVPSSDPPRWAERFLRWWLPDGVVGDSIMGDAREEFHEYARREGLRLPPGVWYWLHCAGIAAHYVWRESRSDARYIGSNESPLSAGDRVSGLLSELRRVTRKGGGLDMGALFKDLKFGARALIKKPGSAIISVVVLSLGIGLTAFMYSLVYGVFYRGLGVPQEEHVATVWFQDLSLNPLTGQQRSIASQDFLEIRERQRSFGELSAYFQSTVNVSGVDGPERYQGAFVTANAFEVLQVQPIFGRAFLEGEDTPGSPPTILIGYDMWQDRYDADPGVLGQTLRINGEQGTIVGVMPEGFKWPRLQEIWITMDDAPLETERWQGRFYGVMGRLRDGVTWDQAALEFASIAGQLEQEYPDTNEGLGLQLLSFADSQSQGALRTIFIAMMVGALLVLLVACANVANLLLARAAVRTKEAAVRVAMGAGRFRVMIPFFSEALVLAAVGALVGLGIAYYSVGLFDAATDGSITGRPAYMQFKVDLPIFLFVVGVTALTALVAGAAPALQVGKADVNGILKDESRGSSSFHLGRLAKVLVIAEVALSCALLVGAGLMTKSIVQVSRFEFEFDPDRIFSTRMGLFATDYPERADRQQLFDELLPRIEGLSNVRAASLSNSIPGGGGNSNFIRLEGVVYEDDSDRPLVQSAIVSPGFFELLGIELTEGEPLSSAHTRDVDRVAIVNESFARTFWPGESPLGRRFRTGTADSVPWMGVIGVVPDLHMEGFSPPGFPGSTPAGFYMPVTQADPSFLNILAVPAVGGPMDLTADIREVVRGLDPDLPIYNTRTVREAITRGSWFYSVFGTVFIVFGIAALFMASVGLYGVLSFSVSRRVQEMGIRMAMGAQARDVIRLILRQGAGHMGIGLAIGMVLAWAVSRMIAFLMFQVDPRDLTVYGTVLAVICSVGFFASWVPAKRATGVDPVNALRYD